MEMLQQFIRMRFVQTRAYQWVGCRNGLQQRVSGKGFIVKRSISVQTMLNPTRSLFDLPETVLKPEDFVDRSREAVSRINFIRRYLPAKKDELTHSERLRLLDAISVELCNIIDAAELCRNAHSDEKFRSSAETSFSILSQLIIDLNSDVTLYEVLEDTLNSATIIDTNLTSNNQRESNHLSKDEYYFGNDLLTDFRLEGIHLIKQQRSPSNASTHDGQAPPSHHNLQGVMKDLQREIINTETNFSLYIREQSFQDKNNLVTIGPFNLTQEEDYSDYQHMSSWLKQQLQHSFRGKYEERINRQVGREGFIYCPSNRSYLGALMNSIHNEEIRKSLWFEQQLQPITNITNFTQLLQKRHQLSALLGFPSYSHRILTKSIFKRPEEIQGMLKSLSHSIDQQTKSELKQLEGLKTQLQQHEEGSAVQPWDVGFLQYAHQSLQQNSDGSDLAQQRVREYLPLSQCLQSLQMISEEVYSIRLQEESITASEAWVDSSLTSTLKKYVVLDLQTNSKIGTVYFDLFHRPGKFPGAAHFTVRCGCDKLNWQIPPYTNKAAYSRFTSSSEVFKVGQQLPTVVLVLPFSGGVEARGRAPTFSHTFLSLSELESLYHEFGHALHSLFSRTTFQHLSGTRGSTDFIEIPSHFMEYFARDVNVIKKWAKNYRTGETIPTELLSQAMQQRKSFIGLDLQTQILFAAVDQHLFKSDCFQDSSATAEDLFITALKESAKIQQEYTIIPLAEKESLQYLPSCNANTDELKKRILQSVDLLPHMQLLNHGHFINYGGSYYSYLLARLYAAQIWYTLFHEDPLSRDAGKLIREGLLAYGSSKPAKMLLDQVVGKDLDPSYFIKAISK